MRYVTKFMAKLIMLPLLILFFIFAYLLFLVHPDYHKFKFKMEQ